MTALTTAQAISSAGDVVILATGRKVKVYDHTFVDLRDSLGIDYATDEERAEAWAIVNRRCSWNDEVRKQQRADFIARRTAELEAK